MRKISIAFLLLNTVTILLSQNQVVNNPLTQELIRIFPEIARGYIDLSGNGSLDQNEDLDELIPESSLKDSLIQGKEILDFILKNYSYIPLETLQRVQGMLGSVKGEIPEVVALRYKIALAEAVKNKETLEAEGPYITPSALREALRRSEEYIGTMVLAYNKEDQEPRFVEARDALFSLIEQGFPLPDALGKDDEEILAAIMIHTILKDISPSRTNAAIRTLGRLGDETSVDYLLSILKQENLRLSAIRALGRIGSPRALNRLMGELDSESEETTRIELIHSIGKIGGKESVSRLMSFLEPESEEPQEIRVAVLNAMVDIADRVSGQRELQDLFIRYLSLPDVASRKLAIRGLSNFRNNVVNTNLLTTLRDDSVAEVKIEAIIALSKMGLPGTVPSFINLLRTKGTSDPERVALMNALAGSIESMSALPYIVLNLGSADEEVRGSAAKALISLHRFNPAGVVGSLGKTLLRSQDELTVTEGTRVLAAISDESSINYLLPLLSSPYPEVKKNATWAMYRIHSAANPRAIEELKRLVKSETETLPVRINAVRALGAIGYDTPQAKVWETLLNVLQMRDDKYSILRYYAIRALGELGNSQEQIVKTLLKLARREKDRDIVQEAILVVQKLANRADLAEKELLRLYKRGNDQELQVRIVEALGDLRSSLTVEAAAALINTAAEPMTKMRVLYALAQVGGKQEIDLVLDAARDSTLFSFIQTMLEDWDQKILLPVVNRRLRSETNSDVLELLDLLQAGIEEGY